MRNLGSVMLGVLIGCVALAGVPHSAAAQEPPPPPQYQPEQPPPAYQPPQGGQYQQQPPPSAYPQQQPPPGYPQQQPPPGYPQQQPPPGYPQQPGYQVPPPGYQQPYQPGYTPYQYSPYARPVYLRPPPVITPHSGLGLLVTGAIFLPVGLSLLAGSAFVWHSACSGDYGCFSTNGVLTATGATFMDIFGVALTVMGVIFIPVGAVHEARYRKWRRSQGLALYESNTLRISPFFSSTHGHNAAASQNSMGLRFEF